MPKCASDRACAVPIERVTTGAFGGTRLGLMRTLERALSTRPTFDDIVRPGPKRSVLCASIRPVEPVNQLTCAACGGVLVTLLRCATCGCAGQVRNYRVEGTL